MKKFFAAMAILGGSAMLIMVAVANSYVAFFVESDYTGGMFAASFFWTVIGFIFLKLALDDD
jgi:hypothetical protein